MVVMRFWLFSLEERFTTINESFAETLWKEDFAGSANDVESIQVHQY